MKYSGLSDDPKKLGAYLTKKTLGGYMEFFLKFSTEIMPWNIVIPNFVCFSLITVLFLSFLVLVHLNKMAVHKLQHIVDTV